MSSALNDSRDVQGVSRYWMIAPADAASGIHASLSDSNQKLAAGDLSLDINDRPNNTARDAAHIILPEFRAPPPRYFAEREPAWIGDASSVIMLLLPEEGEAFPQVADGNGVALG
jgi:hypothetical protein